MKWNEFQEIWKKIKKKGENEKKKWEKQKQLGRILLDQQQRKIRDEREKNEEER